MCLLRAEVANRELPEALEELGAIVDDIAIYKTVAETEDPAGAGARLLAEGADWVTFTSSSTVEHFHARFDLPKLVKQFPQLKLASIGPETSKTIAALGSQARARSEGAHDGRFDCRAVQGIESLTVLIPHFSFRVIRVFRGGIK